MNMLRLVDTARSIPRCAHSHSQQVYKEFWLHLADNIWNFHFSYSDRCAVTPHCDYILHFSITSEVAHLFICVLAIQISSFVITLPHFPTVCLFFFIICFIFIYSECLHIHIYICNIFSYSLG